MLTTVMRWPISYKRQWLYRITNKVRDVVKLHSKGEQPYVVIQQKKIEFPMNTYIANVRMPTVDHFLKFYDKQFNCYYHSTPVSRVISQSFFVEIQEDIYFVMNQDPLLKSPESPYFQATGASANLEPLLKETMKSLQSDNPIQKNTLINTLLKDVMAQSLEQKLEKKMFKELLKVVEKKIDVLEEQIREAEAKLSQTANRRVKWFTTFIMAEIALIHYFIYFNLSWDIMEPITVILANIDLMIGYWFFILKGRPFSCENWYQELFKKHRFSHLRNSGIDINKYEEYLQIKEDLLSRLRFLSKNPNVFMQNCQKPLKILNNQ